MTLRERVQLDTCAREPLGSAPAGAGGPSLELSGAAAAATSHLVWGSGDRGSCEPARHVARDVSTRSPSWRCSDPEAREPVRQAGTWRPGRERGSRPRDGRHGVTIRVEAGAVKEHQGTGVGVSHSQVTRVVYLCCQTRSDPSAAGARGSRRRRGKGGRAADAPSGPLRFRPRVCHCVGRDSVGIRSIVFLFVLCVLFCT